MTVAVCPRCHGHNVIPGPDDALVRVDPDVSSVSVDVLCAGCGDHWAQPLTPADAAALVEAKAVLVVAACCPLCGWLDFPAAEGVAHPFDSGAVWQRPCDCGTPLWVKVPPCLYSVVIAPGWGAELVDPPAELHDELRQRPGPMPARYEERVHLFLADHHRGRRLFDRAVAGLGSAR